MLLLLPNIHRQFGTLGGAVDELEEVVDCLDIEALALQDDVALLEPGFVRSATVGNLNQDRPDLAGKAVCRDFTHADDVFDFAAQKIARGGVACFLLILLMEYYSVKRSAQIQFMKLQNELLKQKLGGNRVILSPEDRVRMLRAVGEMKHDIKDVLGIVSVKTYKQWLRDENTGKEPGRVGRSKILASIREVIIRLAKENVGWGLRRIVGEFQKLTLQPGRSTVRRVLIEEGVLPDRYRHTPKGMVMPWRTFIKGHVDLMIACDFFTKAIWTPLGQKIAYVLAIIHLGTRKVFVSPATEHPTEAWMLQQSRNIHMWAEENEIDLRFLIHDHDGSSPSPLIKPSNAKAAKESRAG
jgi:hypothetical protein